MNDHFRIEQDSLGPVRIPGDSLWGAQTQRAIENFKVSPYTFHRYFIEALGLIKLAAADANRRLGMLAGDKAAAVREAARQVADGRLDDHFPLDIFQTGSGTSTNMNANEVIANMAIRAMGGKIGSKSPVHPNDDVNMSQSSNDVIPSAIHISTVLAVKRNLLPALDRLITELKRKALLFDGIVKTGRTHLQDAVPVRLGQEFHGYAVQVEKCRDRIEAAMAELYELPLGGTAVGTGLNRLPMFPVLALNHLNRLLGERFHTPRDHMEANASRDGCLALSGALRTLSSALWKIANDIRWLGSGPRNGLGELRIPAVQPGSSIMPGKVNPVIAESIIMVCAQVVGNDAAIDLCCRSGNFELNVMMPVISHNLLESIFLLGNGIIMFVDQCLVDLKADEERCRESIERGLALATALAPAIGYDKAAEISKKAFETGRTIREIALEEKVLPADQLEILLDARKMTTSGIPGGK